MHGRLAYKKSEAEALSKLVSLNEKYKSIGRLKHMKEVLEFKIATEARTLEEEKALLKRLGDVEAELKEAIAAQKLRGKSMLVEKDIAELTKREEELNAAIAEANKQIDELKLRLGAATRPRRAHRNVRREPNAAAPLTVSMEDIAIIKTKKGKQQNSDSGSAVAAGSGSDSNNGQPAQASK
ncbi:MAG: hypothetical protein QXT43_01745 [Candidatus Micrarchaeaceae archaeon]